MLGWIEITFLSKTFHLISTKTIKGGKFRQIILITPKKNTFNYYNTSFTDFYIDLEFFKIYQLQDYNL